MFCFSKAETLAGAATNSRAAASWLLRH